MSTLLIVLDGWGHREDKKDNAIALAHKPNFDRLWKEFPHNLLDASGLAVGLPEGQMGNSEIGHTTIGAGKIIDTDLVRIQKSIDAKDFDNNPSFKDLFDFVKKNNSVLHVMGLLSNGGVHSHENHLFEFLRAAKRANVPKVAIHIFTDGRDTPPTDSIPSIERLNKVLDEVDNAYIASISGRYFAMDRDNNWDRVKKTEEAIFECKGNVCDGDIIEYIKNIHSTGKSDEHIEPFVCFKDGKKYPLKEKDAVLFFNFRSDRARMLTKILIDKKVKVTTMTKYADDFDVNIAYPEIKIETTLAKEISKAGLTQAHIAETEKFPHATYFLNGGVEKPHEGEIHIMLDSRKDVPTHDLAPKMRAHDIASKAIEEIEKGTDFIFINFANPDMVGHTANVKAIVEAIEEVDRELGRIMEALKGKGIAFITADHGNAELNMENGKPHTAHTTNKVPAIITDKNFVLESGGLSDIAPTLLSIMNIHQPKNMTGRNIAHQKSNA